MRDLHVHTLDNGFEIRHLKRDLRSGLFYAKLNADVGTAYEAPNEHGLAHFLEHMLFEGDGVGYGPIKYKFSMNGRFNATTAIDEISVEGVVTAQDSKKFLEELSQSTYAPNFSDVDIESERKVIEVERLESSGNPQEVFDDRFFRYFYKKSPVRRNGVLNILGPRQNIKSFTRKNMMDFHERWITPERLTLYIVSKDLDMDLIQEYFGQINKSRTDFHFERENRLDRIEKRVANNRGDLGMMMIGWQIQDLTYEQYIKLKGLHLLMETDIEIPGLSRTLRKKGLIYSLGVNFETDFSERRFTFGTQFERGSAPKIIKIVMDEFEKFRDGKIDPAILDIVIQRYIVKQRSDFDNPEEAINTMDWEKSSNITVEKYLKSLSELSGSDIQEAAQFISPDKYFLLSTENSLD
ncbi:MAG: pitrilysin family protein [Nanoarchaeota archaeon]